MNRHTKDTLITTTVIIFVIIMLTVASGCSVDNPPTEYITDVDQVDVHGLTLKPSTGQKVSFEEMSAAYEQTMACMGMTAPGPIVYFKSFLDYFGGAVGAPWAFHTQGTIYVNLDELPEVGIVRTRDTDIQALKHEYIHNILFHTYGDGDTSHSSPMYKLCGLGVVVNN